MTKEEMKRELGSLIWKTATSLVHGGKVSPVQFMDYMLGALFYRFISENITDYANRLMRESGAGDGDYTRMADEQAQYGREQLVRDKGFFILPSQLFINVANSAKSDANLNTTLRNNFVATCILVLKKNKTDNRICFIDASEEFAHEGNKNVLGEDHIRHIYDVHREKRQEQCYSRVVTIADVEAQAFNLSVSTYVEKADTSERVDIGELNARIAGIVERQVRLREEIDLIIQDLEV